MAISANFFAVCVLLTLYFPKNYSIGVGRLVEAALQIQCQNDVQCQVIESAYVCKDNVCVCTTDNCQDANSIVNSPVSKIGGSCISTSQCLVEKSYCSKRKWCECLENTVSSFNKRSCLSVSTDGSSCQEDVQCAMMNGICQNNKCTCDKSKHLINATCYSTVEVGSACQKNEECFLTEFSACQQHKCSCIPNYIKSLSRNACLPKSKFGWQCLEDIQCTAVLGNGASCLNNSCVCKELYRYKQDTNKCVLDTFLGGKCSKHEECHQPGYGVRRLECILGECKCKSLYTEQSGMCILSSAEGSTEFNKISKIFPYVLSYILFFTVF